MSKIGKKVIDIDESTTVDIKSQELTITGSLGRLTLELDRDINIDYSNNCIKVNAKSTDKSTRAKWGLYRSLINNMVYGVTKGYHIELELVGIGYRALQKGNDIEFQLGYSHPIIFNETEGIKIIVKGNKLTISGIDKQKVGQVAKRICLLRKPDPYKGKGIFVVGSKRRKKQGKK
ncbi:MAG: 50S ribosomal protein L6 [bacterium]